MDLALAKLLDVSPTQMDCIASAPAGRTGSAGAALTRSEPTATGGSIRSARCCAYRIRNRRGDYLLPVI